MTDLETYVDKVVTMRIITGEEIIGVLKQITNQGRMVMEQPRIVLLNDQGIPVTMPWTMTGVNDQVMLNSRNIISVTLSHTESAQDYQAQSDQISQKGINSQT